MTQETKLGLVIGGAFILCFALILSHSEEEGLVAEQMAALLPAASDGLDYAAVIESELSSDPGVDPGPRSATLPPESRMMTALLAGSGQSRPEHSPVADAPAELQAPSDRSVAALLSSARVNTLRQSHHAAEAFTHQAAADAEHHQPASRGQKMRSTPLLVAGMPSGRQHSVSEPLIPDREPPPQPRRVQVYVVSPRDTLTKISRKFYGRSDPTDIERIYHLNRKALPDKNSLRVGQVLEIPLEAASTAREPGTNQLAPRDRRGSNAPAATSRPGPTDVPVKWEWYRIKPRDRYTKIAKNVLGSERRWREIFELNKDTFPDPDRIKPGVRIKVPR